MRPNNALHRTPPPPVPQRIRVAVQAVSPVSATVRPQGQRLFRERCNAMTKPKMLPIQHKVAKQLVRVLDKFQAQSCIGCTGAFHEEDCPAREAYQLRNYLTQRINNPERHFTV